MFLDLDGYQTPSEPWRPEPPPRRLSPRGEKVMLWVIGLNILLLLVAPIGGATLIHALWALL